MKNDTLSSSLKHCPYWLAKSRKCLISSKGLFIPLENHISIFCTTLKHTNCHLYRDELFLQQSGNSVSKQNRRRFNRFPGGKRLTLHQVTNTNTHEVASKTAYTTNQSAGGIQIRTQSPLFHGSLISFSYDKSVKSADQKNLARVMWCQYQKDTLVYLAGLAFQSDNYKESASS